MNFHFPTVLKLNSFVKVHLCLIWACFCKKFLCSPRVIFHLFDRNPVVFRKLTTSCRSTTFLFWNNWIHNLPCSFLHAKCRSFSWCDWFFPSFTSCFTFFTQSSPLVGAFFKPLKNTNLVFWRSFGVVCVYSNGFCTEAWNFYVFCFAVCYTRILRFK